MWLLLAPALALADGGATGEWFGARKRLADSGISPYAIWTGEVFRNFRGGLRTGADWEGVLEFGVDIDLEKTAHLSGATLHASAFWIQDDDDPSATLAGNFDEISNIAAVEGLRLFQLYLKRQTGAFTWKVGQIALDDDFMVSTGASLFINASLGPLPLATPNTLAPAYPIGGLGGWFQWQPNDSFTLQSGVYDGDAGTQLTNGNGFEYDLGQAEGVMFLTEAAISTHLFKRDGTLKVGAFFHTGDFLDYTTGTIVATNSAIYAMHDQILIGDSKNNRLAAFVRGGFSPQRDRNEVDWYLDGGLTAQGFRANDRFGIAFLYAHFGDAFTSAQALAGAPVTSAESTLEITYLLQINDWFSLQPDFQYVFNPQNAAARDAVVAGIRARILF
jgi:porin